jgi:tetratricopeptide (TPR) repeat protein
MLRRIWLWGLISLASSLLLAGCASPNVSGEATRKVSRSARRQEADAERAGEKRAEAHAHYAAGFIHEMNEEPEAALKEYYQAALIDPAEESLILEVSRRFAESKQPDKALDVLTRATAESDASGAVYARLGLLYSQMGKVDQAVTANRIAIKKAPQSLPAYQSLFLNYLQKKQLNEAIKVLDDAAKQPNAGFEFLVGISELYADLSRQIPAQKEAAKAKALELLRRAEKLKPSSSSLRLQLAEGFNSLGDFSKAAEIYLDLLKKFSDVPLVRDHVRAKLTEIYLRGEDHKRAVEQLQGIIRDDPTNPQAYYFLGRISTQEKKLEEAIEYFSKAVLLNKNLDQAYYELAIAQMGLNRTSDALATLQKARERFPQNFIVEYLSALAFSHQKAYTEAIQHYTAAEVIAQARDTNRLDVVFYFEVGSAYERKGDYAQAEKYFEKCLQLKPEFVEALNYLGYMWAEHGMNLEKAHELIQKAVKAEPKNPAYLDSLGWVLFKLNQPKQALDYLLKAVELSKEPDATVYDHLGDTYAALAQTEKAREAWRKSLELEASDLVRKKLEAAGAK